MVCGRMPLAVKSLVVSGKVDNESYELFISWLTSDLALLKKDIGVAERIMAVVVKKKSYAHQLVNSPKRLRK